MTDGIFEGGICSNRIAKIKQRLSEIKLDKDTNTIPKEKVEWLHKTVQELLERVRGKNVCVDKGNVSETNEKLSLSLDLFHEQQNEQNIENLCGAMLDSLEIHERIIAQQEEEIRRLKSEKGE